jgi:hypothetical protein
MQVRNDMTTRIRVRGVEDAFRALDEVEFPVRQTPGLGPVASRRRPRPPSLTMHLVGRPVQDVASRRRAIKSARVDRHSGFHQLVVNTFGILVLFLEQTVVVVK